MNAILKSVLSHNRYLLSSAIASTLLVYTGLCAAQDDFSSNAIKTVAKSSSAKQIFITDNANLSLSVTGELISGRIDNVPIRQVLHELSTKTQIKVLISEKLKPTRVTAYFSALTLDNALRSILGNSSYVLVYDGKGDNALVTAVYVLPSSEALPVSDATEESHSVKLQVLKNALQSRTIPDNIKAALLAQASSNVAEPQRAGRALRAEAIQALLEHIKAVGAAQPETIRQLRKSYELQKTLHEN